MTPLEQKLEQLKLATMSQKLEQALKEAAAKNLSFAAILETLADIELEARNHRSVERRFHLSRLYTQPSIDTFHFQHHKSRIQSKSRALLVKPAKPLLFSTGADTVCQSRSDGVKTSREAHNTAQ